MNEFLRNCKERFFKMEDKNSESKKGDGWK